MVATKKLDGCLHEKGENESTDEQIVGFQGLEWADPDWDGNENDETNKLGPDWAIIATFVALDQQGKGIGRLLFRETLRSAEAAGVSKIDATIRRYNAGGQAYYERMGFRDYHETSISISKRYDVGSLSAYSGETGDNE